MRWIVSSGEDIAVDGDQLQARRNYIRRVTNADVTAWNYISVNGQVQKEFLCCTSRDEVNGTFITAHIGDVYKLCSLREICNSNFVVANTCIWVRTSHKKLLLQMMRDNYEAELFFAKQELFIDSNRIFRQSTTLNSFGQFGFQTSMSERELFRNRNDGLMEAIRESFIRVSPIFMLGE